MTRLTPAVAVALWIGPGVAFAQSPPTPPAPQPVVVARIQFGARPVVALDRVTAETDVEFARFGRGRASRDRRSKRAEAAISSTGVPRALVR
jgi:hypothetical protein